MENALARLRTKSGSHFVLGKGVLGEAGYGLYKLDFLAAATLNRSLCLVGAFCSLVEAKNMIAGAPILRCQLDNALRFSASTLVDQPHDFAWEVVGGTPIRKLKDRSGQKMTDAYLVQQLSKSYPWVSWLYERASGYVHLSEKHIFNAFTLGDREGTWDIKISGQDAGAWTEERYLEAVEAFAAVTDLVLELVNAWVIERQPVIVAQDSPT
jgi:hypothetical protein